MVKKPNEGFSFKCKGAQYRIEWDSVQYILIANKQSYYFASILTLLTQLVSMVPKTSVAGSMHEFTQDIIDAMNQIKMLCRYIEKNFKPQKSEEEKTRWAMKYAKKNVPETEIKKKAKQKAKETT